MNDKGEAASTAFTAAVAAAREAAQRRADYFAAKRRLEDVDRVREAFWECEKTRDNAYLAYGDARVATTRAHSAADVAREADEAVDLAFGEVGEVRSRCWQTLDFVYSDLLKDYRDARQAAREACSIADHAADQAHQATDKGPIRDDFTSGMHADVEAAYKAAARACAAAYKAIDQFLDEAYAVAQVIDNLMDSSYRMEGLCTREDVTTHAEVVRSYWSRAAVAEAYRHAERASDAAATAAWELDSAAGGLEEAASDASEDDTTDGRYAAYSELDIEFRDANTAAKAAWEAYGLAREASEVAADIAAGTAAEAAAEVAAADAAAGVVAAINEAAAEARAPADLDEYEPGI